MLPYSKPNLRVSLRPPEPHSGKPIQANHARGLYIAIEKKIISVNADLIKTGQKDFALNPHELDILAGLIKLLTAATETMPAVVPATATVAAAAAAQLQIPMPAIELVLKVIGHWPYASRLAGLDLLRTMCPADTVAKYHDSRHGSIVDIAIASATETGSADSKLVENSIMMALRLVVNMFATEAGRGVAAAQSDKVVALMECVLGISNQTVGDVKGPIGAHNRNVLIALTSAITNFGVLAHSEDRPAGAATVGEESLTLLLNVVGRVLTSQTDSEVVFRALVGLGNIISIPSDAEYAQVAKTMGADQWVKAARDRASEDRVNSMADAVLRLLV